MRHKRLVYQYIGIQIPKYGVGNYEYISKSLSVGFFEVKRSFGKVLYESSPDPIVDKDDFRLIHTLSVRV